MFFEEIRKSHEYTSLFILAGALGTWLALFVNSSISIANARKQHTINIIFNTRLNSSIYMQHLRRLRKCCLEGNILSESDFLDIKRKTASHDLDAQKIIESIHYLLNYYEFLALGARMGDLDEELLRQTLRSPFLRLVAELDTVITHYRGLTDNQEER